ncbi:MAG: hypothetical protein H8F28_16965 [Fibrella sp.]|nr:hypothetical protein [Armatimonadota bacterium]
MIIKDTNGVEIDTESQLYKDFLQLVEMDRLFPDVQEPSGWMTLGELMDRERWLREQGLGQEEANASPLSARETLAAPKA